MHGKYYISQSCLLPWFSPIYPWVYFREAAKSALFEKWLTAGKDFSMCFGWIFWSWSKSRNTYQDILKTIYIFISQKRMHIVHVTFYGPVFSKGCTSKFLGPTLTATLRSARWVTRLGLCWCGVMKCMVMVLLVITTTAIIMIVFATGFVNILYSHWSR